MRTSPQLIASAFGASSFRLRFPRAAVDAEAFWVASGPHFQSHRLPPLDRTEANTSDRMCLPFQIRPYETSAKSMHLVNSFMYHEESIAQAYEGASWAFPVETLEDTFMTRVHFQGFEIL